MLKLFGIVLIHIEILGIFLLVTPFEVCHHVMLLITHKSQAKRLFEAFFRTLKCDILVAEDL